MKLNKAEVEMADNFADNLSSSLKECPNIPVNKEARREMRLDLILAQHLMRTGKLDPADVLKISKQLDEKHVVVHKAAKELVRLIKKAIA